MRRKTILLTLVAFLFAGVFSASMATLVGNALESRSERHSLRALTNAGVDWVSAEADGLLVTLTGTAPSEAARFRAAKIVADTIGSSRVNDQMEVTPAKAIQAPRFSLELLRNDDGVSVIGLVPSEWESADFLRAANALNANELTNMVETSSFPVPEGWDEAIEFGLHALSTLPRSKISIAADVIRVTAIADSPEQKANFERSLNRARPAGVPITIEISAPRPVITPFTLRFVVENGQPRFDACAADTERARSRIAVAAREAGVDDTPFCTIGLGAPSPRWSDAAVLVIEAMSKLGAGSVTISDVDITLIADSTVLQSEFDRVVGELNTALPDVFSLRATLTPRPQADTPEGPAQFTGILDEAGRLQLRGRLTDEQMKKVVEAFAHARFGVENVYIATRQDESLPTSWGLRVLAGLAALSQVNNGGLLVEPGLVAVRGETGNQGARAEISRLLSDRLGQGQEFRVDVTYNPRMDASLGLPSPQECLSRARDVLTKGQIKFAPGKNVLEGESLNVVFGLVAALKDCDGAKIEVGGHTDSQGRAESNLALSQERADAVLTKLAELGVNVEDMRARGYGASQPIADNKTEAGREANRRIALRLLDAPEEEALTLRDILRELEPEDDGEALPDAETSESAAPEAPEEAPLIAMPPEEEIPMAEGDEPMGEAGDLGGEPEAPTPAPEAEQAPEPEAEPAAEPAPEAENPTDPVDPGGWTAHPEMEGLRPNRRPQETRP